MRQTSPTSRSPAGGGTLSSVLYEFSRYIVTWRLSPTIYASDITSTLDQTLAASGLGRITVAHRRGF
ncbi:hypothetical protein OCA5_pOC16700310 (plasmid) [Afipia carboxidovorans OM5]|uniref:Uncharacterized protein n=1 Tax=Afipia carboxidovorans (strain ATCC 49405 / DSM 1227 / KCTC 32145 / OM5) TaxID=504832 RepID=F8C1B5_AFIC5|nr:hypothetical protein OCA4_pOC167B00310 [Afipia carboxidovorans OM4]AEI08230.1 hypothetical protein OCA5_pOC16700310 [Afipia carboxidovorans OM5]